MQPQHLSLWLKEAHAAERPERRPPLDAPVEADVCIVGGGFTGLWSAIELKQRRPSTRVVLVERGFCGDGASGRNAGFVLSLWAKFGSLQKICGTQEALRLARESAEAVERVGRFCAAQGIEADYRGDGWLWAATSRAQIGAWAETIQAIERHGDKPFRNLDAAEVASASGSRRLLAGVLEARAATIQPARLALGLRRVALELGVRIFEDSPMTALQRGERPSVLTARGRVRADRVILALNAWGVALPEIRKALAVVSSDMLVTAPVSEWLERTGCGNGLGVSDSRMLVHYHRTTPDGRMLFGKGGGSGALAFGARVGSAFDGPSPIAATVRRLFDQTYPELASTPTEQSWTGPVARSWDGLPLFGRFADCPQVLYGIGYSGNGVGPSLLGARILCSLALDSDDEWANAGLVRPLRRSFPPEPFRYVGGKLVRHAIARCERAEDADREPGALVRRIAALAPAGLSPTRRSRPS